MGQQRHRSTINRDDENRYKACLFPLSKPFDYLRSSGVNRGAHVHHNTKDVARYVPKEDTCCLSPGVEKSKGKNGKHGPAYHSNKRQ